MSNTVANAFRALGRHDTKSTELFISTFDQFFDCLNVSNPKESDYTLKAALAPYKSVDDWRFKVFFRFLLCSLECKLSSHYFEFENTTSFIANIALITTVNCEGD